MLLWYEAGIGGRSPARGRRHRALDWLAVSRQRRLVFVAIGWVLACFGLLGDATPRTCMARRKRPGLRVLGNRLAACNTLGKAS